MKYWTYNMRNSSLNTKCQHYFLFVDTLLVKSNFQKMKFLFSLYFNIFYNTSLIISFTNSTMWHLECWKIYPNSNLSVIIPYSVETNAETFKLCTKLKILCFRKKDIYIYYYYRHFFYSAERVKIIKHHINFFDTVHSVKPFISSVVV